MSTFVCVSLKHAPKEIRIEKISGEGSSPGAACMALQNKIVAVALSWEFNMWDEDLSLLCWLCVTLGKS